MVKVKVVKFDCLGNYQGSEDITEYPIAPIIGDCFVFGAYIYTTVKRFITPDCVMVHVHQAL